MTNPGWAPIESYSDVWLIREAQGNTLRSDAAAKELARRDAARRSAESVLAEDDRRFAAMIERQSRAR